jgi:type I restriction enzyme S subunit
MGIPLPPLVLQKEFASRVQEVRDLQAAQAKSAQRIDALYQSMLSRAFAGEL